MQDFSAVWKEAEEAAQRAAERKNAELGPESTRGLDCGFAWLEFNGRDPFGRWAKNAGIAKKHWKTGLYVWSSDLHNVPTQSIGVHQEAARAAAEVLKNNGIACGSASRYY